MRRCLIIAFALMTALVLACVLWIATHREPAFEGKTYTHWLNELYTPTPSANAQHAVRTIGTNGIPFLLDLLRTKHQPDFFTTLATSAGFQIRPAEESHAKALEAFELINTNAAAAVPGLMQILERNYSDSSRICTLGALSFVGPAAEPALPLIVKHLRDPNPWARHNAVQAIGQIGGQPQFTIPALTSALSDSLPTIRYCALFALRSYGSRARSAVPEIQKLWTDPSIITNTLAPNGSILTDPIPMTNMVRQALWWIAPEKTPLVFPIDPPISIVESDQTTCAIKAAFDGKIKTIQRGLASLLPSTITGAVSPIPGSLYI
jgi:hypothetical protein